MASFTKNNNINTPFGRNEYLRSTVGCKFESYTVAAATVPATVIDGVGGQKSLQRGVVMAKITSGPDAGKIGPFQGSGTAEVQTLTASGTVSGGTYTLTFAGQTTSPIAYNASAATVQAALEALAAVVPGDVLVGGGPFPATPLTFTFYGNYSGDAPTLTITTTGLTGSTPGAAFATSTAGVAGAADGRQTLTNIVGLNDTFLPWQLMESDREVAVCYHATAVQGWCFEMTAAGVFIAVTNTTALAMRPGADASNPSKLGIGWA
jgi:hypothetical protein